MRAGGGRQKGSSFERQVAKLVVEAFRPFGIKREDCYRTPMSGGHRFARKEDPGDLVISPKLARLFPFVVECKRNERMELFHFLIPDADHLKAWVEHQWLDQADDQSTVTNREPLLVFRTNRTPVLCAYQPSIKLPRLMYALEFRYKGEQWKVTLFDTFLKGVVGLRKTHFHTRAG